MVVLLTLLWTALSVIVGVGVVRNGHSIGWVILTIVVSPFIAGPLFVVFRTCGKSADDLILRYQIRKANLFHRTDITRQTVCYDRLYARSMDLPMTTSTLLCLGEEIFSRMVVDTEAITWLRATMIKSPTTLSLVVNNGQRQTGKARALRRSAYRSGYVA
jgi:hypothetical protein